MVYKKRASNPVKDERTRGTTLVCEQKVHALIALSGDRRQFSTESCER
ncbi:MAG: hypothetical protein AB7E42_03520 [Anaerotignaceae bacterium]